MTKPKPGPTESVPTPGRDRPRKHVHRDSMSFNEFHLSMNFTSTGSRTKVSGITAHSITLYARVATLLGPLISLKRTRATRNPSLSSTLGLQHFLHRIFCPYTWSKLPFWFTDATEWQVESRQRHGTCIIPSAHLLTEFPTVLSTSTSIGDAVNIWCLPAAPLRLTPVVQWYDPFPRTTL